ncbi:Ku protein [Shinella sp. CPCC 101442]|uniref:Ku protein n=1 Tax=Shinella sp. CPCC 101442 TaxID=2932265 RepID=UPI0035B5621C
MSVTGKTGDEGDVVKGYPRGEDDYEMLEDDEIEEVALDSTRTIDIHSFVPSETIEWIGYDTPYLFRARRHGGGGKPSSSFARRWQVPSAFRAWCFIGTSET